MIGSHHPSGARRARPVRRSFSPTPRPSARPDPADALFPFLPLSVLKMLAMEPTPDPSKDPVDDFLTTGRTGRRNAMADILGEHAATGSGDLSERMEGLSTDQTGESNTSCLYPRGLATGGNGWTGGLWPTERVSYSVGVPGSD